MKELGLIYAATRNRVIGDSKTNNMPWPRLKKDMQFFKQTTEGGSVIMGRKTFDSIKKPLPNRENIIVTRQNINIDGCLVAGSLSQAIELSTKEKVFIIGGAEIYNQALPLVDKIYHTTVKQDYAGDVVMPELPGYWLAATIYEDDQILIEELDRVY